MLIENKDARIYHLAGVSLMPGMNDIAPAAWATASGNAVVQALLTQGLLSLGSPVAGAAGLPGEPAKTEVLESLASLSASAAIALVSKTLDKTLLTKWAAGESRKKVSEALDAQFDTIDPTKPS